MTTENAIELCLWTLFVSAICALNACSNEPGLKTALGDYNYTIAGSARIYDVKQDFAFQARLTPENGTMTIVRGEEKEMAKINFWSNNGDAYTLNAIISHDTVFIDQSYRDIYVDEAKSLFSIAVNGEGRLLSNGDINILLYYNGRAHNAEYVLTGSQIQLLAKKQ